MLYMPLNSYIPEQTESNFAQITFQFRPFCNVVEGFDVERLALRVER